MSQWVRSLVLIGTEEVKKECVYEVHGYKIIKLEELEEIKRSRREIYKSL